MMDAELIKSFKIQDNLNPKVWEKDGNEFKMKSQVRERLLEIAYQFIDFLGVDIVVTDIILTGSLSNYNWSKYSDIDLHLFVDFSQFDEEDVEVYKELFQLKKTLFNTTHNITVKGFEVELYAQNVSESHFSTGVYSVLFDEWIQKPEKESVDIDKSVLTGKAKMMMDKIDSIIEDAKNDDYETAVKRIDSFKEKLKNYRTAGLEKGGEFSYENLTFKFLRRNGYIDKLFNFKDKLMDKELSIENKVEE